MITSVTKSHCGRSASQPQANSMTLHHNKCPPSNDNHSVIADKVSCGGRGGSTKSTRVQSNLPSTMANGAKPGSLYRKRDGQRNRGSGIIRNGVSSGKPAPAVAVPSASSSTVKSSVNNRIYSGTGIRVPGHHGHTGRLLSEVDEEIEQNGGEENRPTRPRLSSSSFPTNCQRSRSKSSVRLHQNGDVSSPPGPCPRRKGEHKPTNTSRDVGNVSPTPSFKLALECPRKIDSPPTSVKRTLSISQNKPSTPVNRSNSNHTNNSNNHNNGVSCHPCPAVSSDDPLQRSVLAEFDLSVRNQKPNVDKAKILNSPYYQSLLRVSWNLIEAEILHSPDSFDMGYDIQQYYALHQSLTLEDLARANSRHTLNGLMRVVSKVLKYLDNLSEVEDYLKFVGRIHDCAGVDPNYLDLTGLAFCQALDHLGHHTDIWNAEVKDTWKTFFRVVVRIMKKGYAQNSLLVSHHHRPLCGQMSAASSTSCATNASTSSGRVLSIPTEHKTFITEVWVTFQDNIIHYLKNSLLLPLVIRSNRTISKYFVGYDTTISCLKFDGSAGISTLGKTKHASWFLTSVLSKVIPHLDNLETCEDYLEDLGRRHYEIGVRVEHLDLLALVYCSAVRAVVAGQGVRGGPLFDTTRAWFHFLRAIVSVMKRGYSNCHSEIITDEGASDVDVDLAEDFRKMGSRDRNSHRLSLCPAASGQCCDDSDDSDADQDSSDRNNEHRSPSGGSGNSHNFTIMKRRNAFWNLDCSTEGLAGGNQPHSPQIHPTAAAAAAVVAASHQAGIFASLVNVNGIGIGLSAGFKSPTKPTKKRTRQFSLQF